jgi:zinc/manganese transport system substrate-binding protein
MVARNTRSRLLALVVIFTMAVSGCGGDGPDARDQGLTIVATTTILGDVVSNIVGDDGRVEVLVPVGADPHDFQASAAQVAAINEADLVVANGLGLEEGLEDVLEAAADDGARVFAVAPLLNPIPFGSAADEHGEDHEHGSEDPHVWFDPTRMAEASRLIATQLAEVDPSVDWQARGETYAAALDALDEEVASTLASIPAGRRLLVTNHGSMGYFADRYDFDVVGTVIPAGSTLADPSSEELSQLIEVMQSTGMNAIFAETTQPSALAEAVAGELGEDVAVVSLYTGSLGEPGSGAETYIDMLRTDAQRIADALAD